MPSFLWAQKALCGRGSLSVGGCWVDLCVQWELRFVFKCGCLFVDSMSYIFRAPYCLLALLYPTIFIIIGITTGILT